ncbi:MAG: septum site-determining protein MinC [Plectolyngbya sp. WJT66-NPBG17]|jgi:septum site-determining protein MinC|nr:septum site-determining protein MinC [Plectolyngbya sp. WJT66-NPBG17]
MTSDTSVSPLSNDPTPTTPESVSSPDIEADLLELPPLETPDAPRIAIEDLQVRLKSKDGAMHLILPPESEAASKVALAWGELWQQFKQLLAGRERFWQPNTIVHLIADDRLLDTRQISAIAEALTEVQLQLKSVHTRRRQTAVVAATAGYSVEQITAADPLAPKQETPTAMEEPLYIQMTLRSGTEIRHNGTVIVLGDLNPGSTIVAEGDILVWGRLRGVAHAGCKGNVKCLIMALQLEPTQIRIADYVARAPETPLAQYFPEVAYVSPQGSIRIARAADFVMRKED